MGEDVNERSVPSSFVASLRRIWCSELARPPTDADAFADGGACLEGAVGFLFADPAQERLELGGLAERLDCGEVLDQLGVGERRVNLAVARAAQGRAVLGFTTLLFGREVVAGDQARGDRSAVELADGGGVVAHGWMVVRK